MTEPRPSKVQEERLQGKWAAIIGAILLFGLAYWGIATLTQSSFSDRGGGPATMTTPGSEARQSSFANPHGASKLQSGDPSAVTNPDGPSGAGK
jgi:hypothetical protein